MVRAVAPAAARKHAFTRMRVDACETRRRCCRARAGRWCAAPPAARPRAAQPDAGCAPQRQARVRLAGGARRAGPERVTRGQAAEKKSAVLDLSKHVDQRVRVKFTGGREGESLCPARDDGVVCASPAQHAEQACVRPPRAGGDATRRGGATGAERCSARAPCTDARRRTLVAASGRRRAASRGATGQCGMRERTTRRSALWWRGAGSSGWRCRGWR